MMINASVNAKNQLIKVYAIRDLFGILVIVNANAINHVILVIIQIMKIVSARKKLVEECTENIDKVKIAEMALLSMKMSVYVLAQFVLCWL